MYYNKGLIVSIIFNVILVIATGVFAYLYFTNDSAEDTTDKVVEEQSNKEKNTDSETVEENVSIPEEAISDIPLDELEFVNERNLNNIQDGLILVYNDKENYDGFKSKMIQVANKKDLTVTLLNLDDVKDKKIIQDYINENKDNIEKLEILNQYRSKLYDFQSQEYKGLTAQLESVHEKMNNTTDESDLATLQEQEEKVLNELSVLENELYEQFINVINENISFVSNEVARLSEEFDASVDNAMDDETVKSTVLESLKAAEHMTSLSSDELYDYIRLTLTTPTNVIFNEMPESPAVYFVHNHFTIENVPLHDAMIIYDHQLIQETEKFNVEEEIIYESEEGIDNPTGGE